MVKKSQWAQVGKRKVELSNLEKVLFPEDGILKAEVIQYYLTIAPTILHHIKGRALTLIRFPDGIHGNSFYQKNKPDWTPDWIEFQALGSDETKDYILATESASLVWLANLACLELHQLHSSKPSFDAPNYIVFDIDPPEGYNFRDVVGIAFQLKEHIEAFGYHTFVKTTGGKGVHIVVPIKAEFDFNTVFLAAQDVARPFVEKNKDVTLHIKKEARKGRVLIDIYRNRSGQSIVSPYSIRGRIGAPVSMPLRWDELQHLQSPLEFNIRNAVDKILSDGDAWDGMAAYATEIHTHRKAIAKPKKLPVSKKRKTPEQLASYEKKRDFTKTSEPGAEIIGEGGNNFVVHRHHASHLHYDLRLEQDGVLKSWAVPRGLPPYPGIKRLAVQTEDHPMKYLTFDGKIPKGQYGGGDMWVFALGKYVITKKKKDGFYFRLSSKEVNGEYRIYKIKEKEFLLERVDESQIQWLSDNIEFMLSENQVAPPAGDDYLYEVKWDGIRAMVSLDEGQVRIKSRNQNDITQQFPELLDGLKAFRANNGLFDCEIVCLDSAGRPQFKKVINRLMSGSPSVIEKLSKSNPVYCYVFDCLYLDGRSLVNEPLTKRKDFLKDSMRADTPYRFSQAIDDGHSLFEAARVHSLEGIMAKRKEGRYLPGKRSDNWLKIKVRNSVECLVIGYTKGKGNRAKTVGALHIAERINGELVYRGKVGTGFTDKIIQEIVDEISQLKEIKKPVKGKVLEEKSSIWVEPVLFVEISYAMITSQGIYREPVFIRMRPDLVL